MYRWTEPGTSIPGAMCWRVLDDEKLGERENFTFIFESGGNGAKTRGTEKNISLRLLRLQKKRRAIEETLISADFHHNPKGLKLDFRTGVFF